MSALESGDLLGTLLMRESLDHCVKCTICETFCPVSNVTPLFPGPKYAGPQSERFRVADEPSPDASLDYCSGCGICTQVCPQGVHIAEINTQARAKLREKTGHKLRDRVIARPTLTGRLGTPAAPVANWSLSNPAFRVLVEKTIGIDRRAPVPKFAGRTFQRWARKHTSPPAERKVAFFHGCGTNYYEPRLGEMTVELLEHNGIAVEVPKQDCCGLPLQSNGLFKDARTYVHRLAERLAPFARAGVDIVGTSTSCTLMLKREALEILELGDDEELLRGVGAGLRHLRVPARDARARRAEDRLRARAGDRHLSRAVPAAGSRHRQAGAGPDGADPRAERRREHRQLLRHRRDVRAQAREVRRSRWTSGRTCSARSPRTAPIEVVCDSETCRWQIEQATKVHSVHPVEMLHRASRL